MLFYDPGTGLAADRPEEGRPDQELQEGAAHQPPDDYRRHRVKDFFARLAGSQRQRHQADPGRQGGHQHRCQPLLTRADNHLAGPALALVFHQVQVMVQQQNPVPRGDAAQRDEAHHAGDGQRLAGQMDRGHRADERHG